MKREERVSGEISAPKSYVDEGHPPEVRRAIRALFFSIFLFFAPIGALLGFFSYRENRKIGNDRGMMLSFVAMIIGVVQGVAWIAVLVGYLILHPVI